MQQGKGYGAIPEPSGDRPGGDGSTPNRVEASSVRVAEITAQPVPGSSSAAATPDQPPTAPDFLFPGYGNIEKLQDLHFRSLGPMRAPRKHKKLGEWAATAIAGNDITSSVLYVTGILSHTAGHLAPVCTLGVVITLYFFKAIYGEVGSAMPLNGGTYNLLLNTTSKSVAAMAACLTILSYVATAVVSASEAMAYADNVVPINTYVCSIALLYFFALLTFWGIKESSAVALAIFCTHLFTMVLLIILGVIYTVYHPNTFWENWATPPPISAFQAVFFGFCAAMLGVTGFETSSNYIEDQAPGVFQKTLRNMWLCVAILNPLLSFVALGVLPQSVMEGRHSKDALAHIAKICAGHWFHVWVSLDAFFVLAGSVLTSFVGVNGLIRRMAMDRCFPQALMSENQWRRTNHWIILSFFVVTSSMFLILDGDVESLAGVYTVSFLSVMALFAIGNMLLKVKRSRLKREVIASWPFVFFGLASIILALTGNIIAKPTYLRYFFIYLAIVLLMIFGTIKRVAILEGFHYMLRQLEGTRLFDRCSGFLAAKTRELLRTSRARTVMFFTKDCDVEVLMRAATYVIENEDAANLKVTHCFSSSAAQSSMRDIETNLEVLDRIYPKLKIDLVMVEGEFNPGLVDQLSRHFGVPKNFMFIACPGDRFPHDIAALGGVRLITY